MFHIFKKNKSAFSNTPVPSITEGEKWAKLRKKAAEKSEKRTKTNLSEPFTDVTSNRLEAISV
ncbi:MAG: hypothetical protein RL329_3172 [Bacteroidota bacterium]|jgi:hypothetical protein